MGKNHWNLRRSDAQWMVGAVLPFSCDTDVAVIFSNRYWI